MPEHRQDCTYMILKDIDLIQSQLQQHKATHGKFTIEVAKQELLLTETHINSQTYSDPQGWVMMMIAFITFKSSLVPLFEGL